MGRVLGEEEVMFGKGNETIPDSLGSGLERTLQRSLGGGLSRRGRKGFRSRGDLCSPVLRPLLSPGYPQEASTVSTFLSQRWATCPYPHPLFTLCLVTSCPPHHIRQNTSSPLAFLLRLLIPALVPITSCITHQLLTATPTCGPHHTP